MRVVAELRGKESWQLRHKKKGGEIKNQPNN